MSKLAQHFHSTFMSLVIASNYANDIISQAHCIYSALTSMNGILAIIVMRTLVVLISKQRHARKKKKGATFLSKTKIKNISILNNDDDDGSVPKLAERHDNNTSTQPEYLDDIEDLFFTFNADELTDHECKPTPKPAATVILQQIKAQCYTISTSDDKTIIALASNPNDNRSDIIDTSIGQVSFGMDNCATHHISNDKSLFISESEPSTKIWVTGASGNC